MRCSSCNQVLDRYLAGALSPRKTLALKEHLRTCTYCAALLEEMKVVDALLATTNAAEPAPNFTSAAMAGIRSLPPPRPVSRSPLSFVAIYLCAAWVGAAVWFISVGVNLPRIEAWSAGVLMRGWAVFGSVTGTGHALAHSQGPFVAFGLGVLLLDAAFGLGIVIIYRVVRPHIATCLAPTEAP